MKKIKSLFIIGIFIFSLFNLVDNVNADNACCAKSGNSYCTFTDESKCDSGYQKSTFACNQVDFCANVCMVDSSGICYQQISKAKCEDLQKKDPNVRCLNQPECNVQQCVTGFCVIGGQCQSKVSATQCKLAADKLKVPYVFDSSVTSETECKQKYSTQEGCCVTGNSCQRTTAKDCSGDFKANVLCSNDELAGVCQDYKKQDDKKCDPSGEDVYYTDSRGNYENVVGVPYDGFIHDKPNEIISAIGNCDYSKGTVCGKDATGEFACIDINCDVGDEFIQASYSQAKSEVEKQSIKVTSELLAGQNTRKNGESWCVLSDKLAKISTVYKDTEDNDGNLLKTAYLNEKESPGSRHYKFSCVNGKVQVEPCGEFRDSICKSAVDTTRSGLITSNFETASCTDNRWEKCTSCKASWYSFVPIWGGGDGKNSVCESRGACVYDTQDVNECWPKYPPGLEFIDLKTSSAPSGQDPTLCSVCGAGAGQCDDSECNSMGDCSFKDTMPVWGGVLIGGTIGFAVGTGFGYGVQAAGTTAGGTTAGTTATKVSTSAKIGKGLLYTSWIPQTINGIRSLFSGGPSKQGGNQGGQPQPTIPNDFDG